MRVIADPELKESYHLGLIATPSGKRFFRPIYQRVLVVRVRNANEAQGILKFAQDTPFKPRRHATTKQTILRLSALAVIVAVFYLVFIRGRS